ncbi:MAG: 50S ribosomal protein L28 [Chloroflexi bacterium]|nr:50S ribosomal protein L28 [Chloroflexota bacterium]
MRCQICGKTAATGYNVSHSKRHTKRVWSPNIQWTRLVVGDTALRIRACTRCMRSLRKEGASKEGAAASR